MFRKTLVCLGVLVLAGCSTTKRAPASANWELEVNDPSTGQREKYFVSSLPLADSKRVVIYDCQKEKVVEIWNSWRAVPVNYQNVSEK